jgi:hypothetical protein
MNFYTTGFAQIGIRIYGLDKDSKRLGITMKGVQAKAQEQ